MCERCQNPDITKVNTYTVTKPDGKSHKAVLCDACADLTRAVFKVTGGKAPEAQPSAPEPEITETPKVTTKSTTAKSRRN